MDANRICPKCLGQLDSVESKFCVRCGYKLDSEISTHVLKPKTILNGKYLVGKSLGEGGFGITYIGMDLNLEVKVAIKEFYPNGFVTRNSTVSATVTKFKNDNEEQLRKWQESFLKEARSLGKFSSLPGVVSVRDFFTENNTAYIVMEYVDGVTLKDYLKSNGGRISVKETIDMITPVIHSLHKIHCAGIVHRDISPDNIMIQEGGEMKLIDFGAAREFSGESERSLSIMLKPAYAPEEQYRTHGNQGPWTDVYAICATIYRCITGVKPVESMERMRRDTLKKPSELGVEISPEIEKTLMEGLAVFAEDRIKTMQELETRLKAGNSAPSKGVDSKVSVSEEIQSVQEPVENMNQTRQSIIFADKVKSILEKIIAFVKSNKKLVAGLSAVVIALLVVVVVVIPTVKHWKEQAIEKEEAKQQLEEEIEKQQEEEAEKERKQQEEADKKQQEEEARKQKEQEEKNKKKLLMAKLSEHDYSLDYDYNFKNAYINKINKETSYSWYDLHHINGDDIPELVMKDGNGMYQIFSYQDGSVVKLYGGSSVATDDKFLPYNSVIKQFIRENEMTQYVYLMGKSDHKVVGRWDELRASNKSSEVWDSNSSELDAVLKNLESKSGYNYLFTNLDCGRSSIVNAINNWEPDRVWINDSDNYSGSMYESGFIGKNASHYDDKIRIYITSKRNNDYYSINIKLNRPYGETINETVSDACLIDGRYEGITKDGYRFTIEATSDRNLLFYSEDYSRIVLSH